MTRVNNNGKISGALVLAVIAAICTSLVAITHDATREQIKANQQAFLERSLEPALAGLEFDNHLLQSAVIIPAADDLPGKQAMTIYRALLNGTPVAALFVVTARDGYSGAIQLLIGITATGEVTAVRVLDHKETPGLGDGIEISRSNWIQQFAGRSLGNPPLPGWAIRRDGGDFEQLTGASVTPRAVIKVLRETLVYFEAHQETLFVAPLQNKEPDE